MNVVNPAAVNAELMDIPVYKLRQSDQTRSTLLWQMFKLSYNKKRTTISSILYRFRKSGISHIK
jgi:hypothetical protein